MPAPRYRMDHPVTAAPVHHEPDDADHHPRQYQEQNERHHVLSPCLGR